MNETHLVAENMRGPEAVVLGLLVLMGLFIVLMYVIIKLVVYCRIFSKAGYCWAFGLLMVIPFAHCLLMLILAFSDWPVAKELRLLKSRAVVQFPPPPQQQG